MTTRTGESQSLDNQTTTPRPPTNPEWTGELGRHPLPLAGYTALVAVYGVGVVSLFRWAHRSGRTLDSVSVVDIGVLGLGSHKLARMAGKDRVTTALRKPFTVYQGTDGALPGETNESARRNTGSFRQAIGELLTCPYCMTTWAATAVVGTYIADRNLGRTIGSFLSALSLGEMMQTAYHKVINA